MLEAESTLDLTMHNQNLDVQESIVQLILFGKKFYFPFSYINKLKVWIKITIFKFLVYAFDIFLAMF